MRVKIIFSKRHPLEETKAKWVPFVNFNFHATVKLWMRAEAAGCGYDLLIMHSIFFSFYDHKTANKAGYGRKSQRSSPTYQCAHGK